MHPTELITHGNKICENGPGAHQRCFVCEVGGQQLPERLAGEYARLFAASPDLLEACRAAIARLEMTAEHLHENAHGSADNEIADRTFQVAQDIRATIAKATS